MSHKVEELEMLEREKEKHLDQKLQQKFEKRNRSFCKIRRDGCRRES